MGQMLDVSHNEGALFALLRLGLGTGGASTAVPALTPGDWDCLYRMAGEQSVLGIAYAGIERLPKDAQPPMELAFQWASEAETVRGHNRLVNAEASRLTELFAAAGRKTAVLKGPANAMLYPDPLSRQCGDIDLWVEGGRKSVLDLLKQKNLVAGVHSLMMLYAAPHHVDLAPGPDGIHVEIHFEPSSGNKDPFANRRMMRYLAGEIAKAGMSPGGFCVPSIRFALVMQLSHIQRHFISTGIGLRQIVDYYVLLQNSTEADRAEVAARLRAFGLIHMAGALMWVLGEKLGLERNRMLCRPDGFRGRWLLSKAFAGGNLGLYAVEERGLVRRWIVRRWRLLRCLPFAPAEVFWTGVDFVVMQVRSIPVRIRLRKLSLDGV